MENRRSLVFGLWSLVFGLWIRAKRFHPKESSIKNTVKDQRASYENRFRMTELTLLRSVFIRGGESKIQEPLAKLLIRLETTDFSRVESQFQPNHL
jgi:hypothetical protein